MPKSTGKDHCSATSFNSAHGPRHRRAKKPPSIRLGEGLPRLKAPVWPSEGIDSVLQRTGAISRASSKTSPLPSAAFSSISPPPPSPDIDMGYTGYNLQRVPHSRTAVGGLRIFHWLRTSCRQKPASTHLPGLHARTDGARTPGSRRPQRMAARPISTRNTTPPTVSLAQELLYWGKVLFIAKCIAPDVSPWDLMDWTPARMAMGAKPRDASVGRAAQRRVPLHHQTHGHTALGGRRSIYQGGRSPSRQSRSLGLVHGTALGRGFYDPPPRNVTVSIDGQGRCACPFCSPTDPRAERQYRTCTPWPTTAPPTFT